jgi:hypothetical protein
MHDCVSVSVAFGCEGRLNSWMDMQHWPDVSQIIQDLPNVCVIIQDWTCAGIQHWTNVYEVIQDWLRYDTQLQHVCHEQVSNKRASRGSSNVCLST